MPKFNWMVAVILRISIAIAGTAMFSTVPSTIPHSRALVIVIACSITAAWMIAEEI